ncbi:hypothetical protein [Prevotella sp.]|uniref:hypothetical protein n=1 Tax=Prevotella sp. TaxID=59823 RepID=UPI0025D2CC47|nr:hypothetical protein [Prevotella sp.]
MVKHLNEEIHSSETDIVIALSRKGPRMLEYLKRYNSLKEFSFTTEHALPFIFEQISNNRDKKYRIFIVDDAIYFGSTIQNLYNEIKAYIDAYKLDNVKIYAVVTAIKASDSKTLNIDDALLLNYEGKEPLRAGYGHYFVKCLMNDFSKLDNTLEVEFPTIEYDLPSNVDEQIVDEAIKKQYPDAFRSEQNGESRAKWCIILENGKTSAFNKVRIFISANKLRFVFMNPHYFNNNEETLAGLMVRQGSPFREMWNEIQLHFKNVELDIRKEFNNEIRRNRLRTQVILANYILSFNNFLVERDKINAIVGSLGIDENSYSIKENNLTYLIGNVSLVANTIGRLKVAADSNLSLDPLLSVKEMTVSNDYVLESNSLPKDELEVLLNHNLVMISKSQDTEESLSAMFNNLTILIEKWTRGTIYDDNYRLRFGYTMKNLTAFVHRYGAFKIEEPEKFQTELHSWIDNRIDNGCIVPQYIVDSASSTWMRVFRPGENEDLLLSHLARLVLCVWNQANEILQVQKVNTYTYQSLLSVVIDTFRECLEKEESYLQFRIDGKLLPCIGDKYRNIVDYMKDMYILTEENDFLECSPRLQNKEFKTCTTLSRELEENIRKKIKSLLSPKLVLDNPFGDFSGDINYELKELLPISKIEVNIQKLKDDVHDLIQLLLVSDGNVVDMTDNEVDHLLSNYFAFIKPYLLSDEKVSKLEIDGDSIYYTEEKLQKILSLYNILLLVYNYNDDELLTQYLENKTFLYSIGMGDIVTYIQDVCLRKAKEEFHNDNTLIGLLLKFADSI